MPSSSGRWPTAADAGHGRSRQLFRAIEELVGQLRAEGRPRLADEIAGAWATLDACSAGCRLFVDAVDSVNLTPGVAPGDQPPAPGPSRR